MIPVTGRKGMWIAVMLIILPAFLPLAAWANQEPESIESRWPREIARPGGKIVIYQPQLLSLKDISLTARTAVAVTPKGSGQPIFGTIWITGRIRTDRENRLVHCEKFFITQVRFPGATREQKVLLQQILKEEAPQGGITFSLDELVAMLELAERSEQTSEQLGTAPPVIISTTSPTILITLDGDPILRPVPGKGLMRVINTPFAMVQDTASGLFFLRAGQQWWKAPAFQGPWEVTEDLPATVSSLLPAPKKPVLSSGPDGQEIPRIAVATEPTELVELSGEGELGFVDETKLFYVDNSDRDIFVDGDQLYVLLSGRWFTASSKNGPWSYVPPVKLPEEFKKIPATFERSHVRVHIDGTREAQEARLDTSIPQTAAIKRSDQSLKVYYDGVPQFDPVVGTPFMYATNTPFDVLEQNGHYHCCFEGVWYDSDSTDGPWTVSTSVPSEVSGIPPQCPLYPVKFVHIYDHTEDVVYVGYTPGYLGSYIQDQGVVFGTGHHYPSWSGKKYFPHQETYGFAALYDPLSGSWMFSPPRLGKGTWADSVLSALEGGEKPWLGEEGWWGIGNYPGFGSHLRPLLVAKDEISMPTTELDNLYLHQKQRLAQASWGGRLQRVPGGGNEVWDNDKLPATPKAESSAASPGDGSEADAAILGKSSDERWESLKLLSQAEQESREAQAAARNSTAAMTGDLYTDEEGNVYHQGDHGWESVGGSSESQAEESARISSRKKDLDRECDSRKRGVNRRRDLIHSTGRMSRSRGFGSGLEYESASDFYDEMGFIRIPAFGQ